MLKRTITSVFIAAAFIIAAFLSSTPVLPIISAALAVCGVYEMGKCVGFKKHLILYIPALVFAVAMPLSARLFESLEICIGVFFAAFYFLLIFYFACAVFSKKSIDISDAAISFATTFYTVFGFSSIVLLRDVEFGKYICLLAVGLPWVSDVFAYLCGRFFGKHKLIPSVSPNKTVEGSIGAIVFTTLICLLFTYIVFKLDDSVSDINYIFVAIAGAVISVVSQIGDLIASLIKRKYGIKDFSNLLPEHGGILDRFDSILSTVPFVLLLCLLPLGFKLLT